LRNNAITDPGSGYPARRGLTALEALTAALETSSR
jgi:hypothetical protein